MLETYSRWIKVGDSEGWCGANFIVLISRPFTAGEDAVACWARQQDTAELLTIVNMNDGRDYMVFKRLHTLQSYRDALREQEEFIRRETKIHEQKKRA